MLLRPLVNRVNRRPVPVNAIEAQCNVLATSEQSDASAVRGPLVEVQARPATWTMGTTA